jgi:hypothetical protein
VPDILHHSQFIPYTSWAGEVGWDLVDSAGEVVASEHPGTYVLYPALKGVSVVNETVSVAFGQEYTLVAYDSFGDGCK